MHKRYFQWIGLAVVFLVIDQITKHLIETHFAFGEIHPVIPGFFNLTLAYNKGAAFSFLHDAGGWQRWFFTVLALGVSVAIIVALKKHQHEKLFPASLALILAGALGNAVDRLALGHVIDFIQVYYQNWYYPAFNIADSAICVGAVLLVIDGFRKKEKTA